MEDKSFPNALIHFNPSTLYTIRNKFLFKPSTLEFFFFLLELGPEIHELSNLSLEILTRFQEEPVLSRIGN